MHLSSRFLRSNLVCVVSTTEETSGKKKQRDYRLEVRERTNELAERNSAPTSSKCSIHEASHTDALTGLRNPLAQFLPQVSQEIASMHASLRPGLCGAWSGTSSDVDMEHFSSEAHWQCGLTSVV